MKRYIKAADVQEEVTVDDMLKELSEDYTQ